MKNSDQKNWLTNRLKTLGMQKKDFALKFGIQAQHVNRFEEIKPKLQPFQMKKLAQILKCSFEALLEFWDGNISAEDLWTRQITQVVELDENLVLKIISRISVWEADNNCELTLKDKALLIKLIYQKLVNVPDSEQENKADNLIDMYEYVKKAN